jgi:hypothetical protein
VGMLIEISHVYALLTEFSEDGIRPSTNSPVLAFEDDTNLCFISQEVRPEQ